MDMIKPTDLDMSIYPHVMFTSDDDWDPPMLHDEYSPSDLDGYLLPLHLPDARDHQYGEILNWQSEYYHDSTEDSGFYEYVNTWLYEVKHGSMVHTKEHDFECLCPNFGWTTIDHIKKTLENTTQFNRALDRYPMRKHYKMHFPATNVNRLNETVATDTIFSDVPAHDDGIWGHGGATMIQFYSGVKSPLTQYSLSHEELFWDVRHS
jgi:hypothetical protein